MSIEKSEGGEKARCVAVLGTASDVGKSVVATALCRILRRGGLSVAPFKAQNMSNNSFVTAGGGEMGRAQVAQAEAARIEPHCDMNPVLLKPTADTTSQVVVLGRARGNRDAVEYFADTEELFREAQAALERLRARHDFVVIEGAGSCAEVNLRERDFTNFRIAGVADAPVLLVADIDRGGVFAQVVGTLAVIAPEDRSRVRGVIVNRFRGAARLFDDGVEALERLSGKPVLGVVPYLHDLGIDLEDAASLEPMLDPPEGPSAERVSIAVVRLPHLSNFTDFAPLDREPSCLFHYLQRPRRLEGYDLLLLPGTKNVRGDLDWLRATGWAAVIERYLDGGGQVGGICGGYQMLGRTIRDPCGVEGSRGSGDGLGLLDVDTTLCEEKTLCRVAGRWLDTGESIEGYEIHMGTTVRTSRTRPAARISARDGENVEEFDGARRDDGRVWGTYCHGLFDAPEFRHAFLKRLRPDLTILEGAAGPDLREHLYERLADHFERHLDMDRLFEIVGLSARDEGDS